KHKKDRAENNVIHSPGNSCTKERQGGKQSKVARLGVHFRSRLEKGQRLGCPLRARVDGLEPYMLSSRARRQAIFLRATEPRRDTRPARPSPPAARAPRAAMPSRHRAA